MKRNTKQTFIKIAHLCEILLSIVILLVILLGIFDILREVYGAYIIDFANPVNYEQLNNFLAQILLLVIAVELVIMLCLHRPETLLEVLAIAAIFFIKKYLIPTNNKNNDNNDNNEQKNSIKSIIASYLKDDDDNVSMF